MAQNIGTLVISAVRPNDDTDQYATGLANEIKGGLHCYATYAEMLAIPLARKIEGMLVSVFNDTDPRVNGVFILGNDLTTWTYFATLQIMPGLIQSVSNGFTYTFLASAPYVYKIKRFSAKVSSTDEVTISVRINGVSIPDLENLVINGAVQTFVSTSTSNYINVQAPLDVYVQSTSSSPDLYLQMDIERELPIPEGGGGNPE